MNKDFVFHAEFIEHSRALSNMGQSADAELARLQALAPDFILE